MNEAKALLRVKHPDGAYYLAGYAVECALKACIAKATIRHDFPDKKKVDASHTHSLNELVKVANLKEALDQEANNDPLFRNNWDVVQSWSEQSRYRKYSLDVTKRMLNGVDDKQHGIMAWIKHHW